MEKIDCKKVRSGFLFMWETLDTNGLISEANDYAECYQRTDENPANLTFICWALVNRFYEPDQDAETVWDEKAFEYLEKQVLLVKDR